MSKHNIADVRL